MTFNEQNTNLFRINTEKLVLYSKQPRKIFMVICINNTQYRMNKLLTDNSNLSCELFYRLCGMIDIIYVNIFDSMLVLKKAVHCNKLMHPLELNG